MDHFRLRKYRGPEVWARVRLAYEAGESGPSVARRFDVGLANIRKKSRREGWSRRDQAARAYRDLPSAGPAGAPRADPGADFAMEGPVDRQAALETCLDHAAAAMARGEAQKALACVRAAMAFAETTRRLNDPGYLDPTEPGRRAATEFLINHAAVESSAVELAERMLAETVDGHGLHFDRIYHWRAERLGPEVAARDRAQAEAEGRADRYWDETGALKPLERGWVDQLEPAGWEEEG